MKHWQKRFFDGRRINIALGYYPMWPPHFSLTENGGRLPRHCLDINWCIWRVGGSFTVWGLGWLGYVLRYVPSSRSNEWRGWE